jgi:hypothetical protein
MGMPSRPFTRRQALQNRLFLQALRRTGNARLAARELNVHRATYLKRRAKSAAFAQDWDAALAAAHAAFHLAGGPRPPEREPSANPRSSRAPERPPQAGSRRARDERDLQRLRTRGGEPTVVRLKSGRLQLRLAPAGRMTKAAEQAFFSALSASANVRLSAAAAGFAHSSFYARARKHRAFAREKRLALEMGYDRLEAAAIASALPDSHEDDGWRHNDPPPIPPMTPDQALQLLCLHEKSVRQSWERPHRRKRRGEPWATYTERLRAMWTAEKAREAEDAALRRAARYEESGDWRLPEEPEPPQLPPLHLVTGWSKARPEPVEGADPKKPKHNPRKALFGGWRLADWRRRQDKK